MTQVLYYLLAINAFTFLVYGLDKLRAKQHRWRIPESTLLGLAVIGGSAGAWIAMYTVSHKTLHPKFKYGVPAIFFVQVALAVHYLVRG